MSSKFEVLLQISVVLVAVASGTTIDGAAVQQALDAAISSGAASYTLPVGNVVFTSIDFTVASVTRPFTVSSGPSTSLWFDVPHGVVVRDCAGIEVRGLTIDYTVKPYVQASIVSVAPGNAYVFELMNASSTFAVILPLQNIANGGQVWHKNGSLAASAGVPVPTNIKSLGNRRYSATTATPLPGAARVGSIVTYKASQGHTYVVANSSRVISSGITIHAASWMAVMELDGECGHTFSDITIGRRYNADGTHADGYLVASNADAFHSADCAKGSTLTDSHFSYVLNDMMNVHSTVHVLYGDVATSSWYLIDPRVYAFGTPNPGATDDVWYGSTSPMSNTIAGRDTVTCFDFNRSSSKAVGWAKSASYVVASKEEVRDAAAIAKAKGVFTALNAGDLTPSLQTWDAFKVWKVALTEAPPAAEGAYSLCTLDRFGNAGFTARRNHFSHGTALLGRVKSSGSKLTQNVWTSIGAHVLEVSPLQNFLEGPLIIDGVTIEGNALYGCGSASPVAPGPSQNVKNIVWRNNTIHP